MKFMCAYYAFLIMLIGLITGYSPCKADTILTTFSGKITYVDNNLDNLYTGHQFDGFDGSFHLGSPYSSTFALDENLMTFNPPDFNIPGTGNVTFGDYSSSGFNSSLMGWNDRPVYHDDQLEVHAGLFPIKDLTTGQIHIGLHDYAGTALTSATPIAGPGLDSAAAWDDPAAHYFFFEGYSASLSTQIYFYGSIDSIATQRISSVPEPSGLISFLYAFCFFGIVAALRKHRCTER